MEQCFVAGTCVEFDNFLGETRQSNMIGAMRCSSVTLEHHEIMPFVANGFILIISLKKSVVNDIATFGTGFS